MSEKATPPAGLFQKQMHNTHAAPSTNCSFSSFFLLSRKSQQQIPTRQKEEEKKGPTNCNSTGCQRAHSHSGHIIKQTQCRSIMHLFLVCFLARLTLGSDGLQIYSGGVCKVLQQVGLKSFHVSTSFPSPERFCYCQN